MPWSYVTSPLYDEDGGATLLKRGEAVFNIKQLAEGPLTVQAGIIKDTGRTIQIGMYPIQFPVARINLELRTEDSDRWIQSINRKSSMQIL